MRAPGVFLPRLRPRFFRGLWRTVPVFACPLLMVATLAELNRFVIILCGRGPLFHHIEKMAEQSRISGVSGGMEVAFRRSFEEIQGMSRSRQASVIPTGGVERAIPLGWST